MKKKNNIFRFLGNIALLLVMLPSFASATGWFSESFIMDPDPPVAGQPFTLTVSIKPGETAPANWVGQITFRVYDPAKNLIYTSVSSISSENNFASASFTPKTAGTYELEIDYDSPYDNEGFHYGSTLPVIKGTNIPEFPTIAVPIAAVLGLVMIFGRKKE